MILKELNSMLAKTQKVLEAEIVTLTEASTAAAAQMEKLKNKAEDDMAKLETEHASVVQAHVLAAELR